MVFLTQPWLVWHAGAFWLFLHRNMSLEMFLKDNLLTFLSLRHATTVPGQSQSKDIKCTWCLIQPTDKQCGAALEAKMVLSLTLSGQTFDSG